MQTWCWAWYVSPIGVTIPTTPPIAICRPTTRTGAPTARTSTFTERTWASVPGLTGGGGGFRSLSSGEDVDLVARFEAAGYCIHRDAELSVATSARTQARAPHGFADHLSQLEGSVEEGCA